MTDTDVTTTTTELPHGTPEEHGIPSTAVLDLVRRWEDRGLEPHSVVVLRHGHVLAEGYWAPYHRDGVQLMYSVSKTFTACAVGLAVGEGLLRLEDRVVDLFPEAASAAGPRAAALTLHDLLAMRTGHRTDTLLVRGEDLAAFPAQFLAAEPEEEPGWFVYNNGATLLAGLAVQRRSGQRLLDYLRPRLLGPLGVDDAAWQGAGGFDAGFSGLHVATAALARLGELVLRDGAWQGRRLLPEGWVQRMTSWQTDTAPDPGTVDWQQGYGYQMWRCRHDAVRADGAFGQFSVIVPRSDLVVAVTECTDRAQETLDAVWDVLLPAVTDEVLPADPGAHGALTAHLERAALPHPVPAAPAPGDGPWTFGHAPSDEVPHLTRVDVTPRADGWGLRLTEGGSVTDVACGDGRWPGAEGSPWVAAGGWTAPGVFEAAVCAVETPHVLRLRGADGKVTASWNGVPLAVPAVSALSAPRDSSG